MPTRTHSRTHRACASREKEREREYVYVSILLEKSDLCRKLVGISSRILVRHGDVSLRWHCAPAERRLFTLTRPVGKDIRSFPRAEPYRNFWTHTFIIATPFSFSSFANAPFVTPSQRTSECTFVRYLHSESVVKTWREKNVYDLTYGHFEAKGLSLRFPSFRNLLIRSSQYLLAIILRNYFNLLYYLFSSIIQFCFYF